MATKVLFHSFGNGKHCPDGFAAALCAWLQFRDEAEYIPCVYQQPAPEIQKGDRVYLLDFSYSREVMEEWQKLAKVTVLDHHKTAQADLEGLPSAQFDMNHSGAQMAWDWFCNINGQQSAPDLIRYVADRDLWKKELPYTEEVHRALMTFPQDFVVWKTLLYTTGYVEFMRRIGEPLYQAHLAKVQECAADAYDAVFLGRHIAVTHTNNYSIVSDALNLACKERPHTAYALNWWEREGKVKMELRSVGEFDVSEIAKQFDGGGHRNAAGCEIDARDERLRDVMRLKEPLANASDGNKTHVAGVVINNRQCCRRCGESLVDNTNVNVPDGSGGPRYFEVSAFVEVERSYSPRGTLMRGVFAPQVPTAPLCEDKHPNRRPMVDRPL